MNAEDLRPFQKKFIRAVENPQYDCCCLSLPRGNGKSTLAGFLLARAMTPGDRLFQAGKEHVLVSGSLEQARIVFRVMRDILEPLGGYRWVDSTQRIGATHLATNSRLRVISSSAKHSFGLLGVGLAILDEPGALENVGGSLLADSLFTSVSKPDSPIKLVMIGTLAPSTSGWWHDVVEDGTNGSIFVMSLQGRRERWESMTEVNRVNPLAAISPTFKAKLREERDKARRDSRLKARFLSYRLNLPSMDESEVLLTVDDYETMTSRPVPERQGQPIVSLDLGSGRAWSAATAAWQTGRVEALAICPGIPSIADQERRDRVSPGTYQNLVDRGLLQMAEGRRVQPPAVLWDVIKATWGTPVNVICDNHRIAELRDAVRGDTPIEPRVTLWSQSSYDIRALRRGIVDGPLVIAEESRPLVATSLSAAMVQNDTSGNVRMLKRGHANAGRDDVAASLILLGGAYQRAEEQEPVREMAHVVV